MTRDHRREMHVDRRNGMMGNERGARWKGPQSTHDRDLHRKMAHGLHGAEVSTHPQRFLGSHLGSQHHGGGLVRHGEFAGGKKKSKSQRYTADTAASLQPAPSDKIARLATFSF